MTLPATTDRLTTAVKSTESAAERTESAAAQTVSKIKTVCLVACIAAVVMPLTTWGLAYWQTSNLRDEQAALKTEADRLQGLAAALDDKTGGGLLLEKDNLGKRYVRLPVGAEVEQQGRYPDGRFGFVYTLSVASK